MARPTLNTHPKFAKLVARLRGTPAPRSIARGALELIWEAGYAEGNALLGDAESVEAITEWVGAPGALAAHLVATGFLDVDDAGCHLIHDLVDHAPDYVARRMARAAERAERGTTISDIRSHARRRQTSVIDDKQNSFVTNVDPPAPVPAPKDLGVAPACAIPEAPYQPPREARRPVDTFGAHHSQAFCRVFDAYPRKDARLKAAVAFQVVAATYDGGEDALASAILAALPALLTRAPYNGPNSRRPYLETVLVERRWEDPASAPDPAPKEAPRCWYHQKPGTNGKTSNKPDRLCPECKHVAAALGTREAEPTAPSLPTFTPPPAWTAEERAEYERIRRGKPTGAQAATGGNP